MPARHHAQLVAGVDAGGLVVVAAVDDDVVDVVLDEVDVELDDDEEEVVVDGVVVGGVDALVFDVVGSGSARTKVTFRLTAGVPVAFFTVSV